MRNFRDLNVWQDSIRLTKEIYRITSKLPKSEMYGLASQMNRAVVSIPSNIAEGSAKDSQKEFIRFLRISLGSAFELETQLEICIELNYFKKRISKLFFYH